ncbi:type II toxin-antitoxin system VapC family toxin [Candidatus Binatus sp.]|uniref:type II toxin-antitoxin system VapC family toxin n=1 Tax=Candidatus Binatus sp. TaxID=2811406 RepID=UPI003C541AD4
MIYLDSSAIVKLVVREPESPALRRFLSSHRDRISCSLARTEVLRAVRHLGPSALRRARMVLDRVHLIRLDDSLLDTAAALDARVLRSLDAIHLAAAQRVAADLQALVTYDQRMAAAAAVLGFVVQAPH